MYVGHEILLGSQQQRVWQHFHELCISAKFWCRILELMFHSRACMFRMSHWAFPLPSSVAWCFAQSFGVGAAAVGTTLTAYAAARLCTNIPSGILADRHGRKPLLICGPAITALGAHPSCLLLSAPP